MWDFVDNSIENLDVHQVLSLFIKSGVIYFNSFTMFLLKYSNQVYLESVLGSFKHYATSWKHCIADVLCRKLSVGQRQRFPHQDVTTQVMVLSQDYLPVWTRFL